MKYKPKILVVDDDSLISIAVSNQLSLLGFKVETAFDGEEGLTKIQQWLPNVVLLDISMPGMDGYEVCRNIRLLEKGRDAIVIMCTAYVGEEEKVKAFKAGANDYVFKMTPIKKIAARIWNQIIQVGGGSSFPPQSEKDKREKSLFFSDLDYFFPWIYNIFFHLRQYSQLQSAIVFSSGEGEFEIFTMGTSGIEKQEGRHRLSENNMIRRSESYNEGVYYYSKELSDSTPQSEVRPLFTTLEQRIGKIRNYVSLQHDGMQMIVFNHNSFFDLHIVNWIRFQFLTVRPLLKALFVARLLTDKKQDPILAVRRLIEYIDDSPGKFSRIAVLIDLLCKKSGCQNLDEEEKRMLPLCEFGRIFVDGEYSNYPGILSSQDKLFLLQCISTGSKNATHLFTDNPICNDIAEYQFERFDGSGPFHLQGEAIPAVARIYTLATAYDALRRKRPYREAFSHDVAVKEIMHTPDKFDPQLVGLLQSESYTLKRIYAL